ncbi:unnamed protein product [Phaedon cochleariae]|uniref:Uncharacterized protein n=1 Tax=Phaedon cochleariae TaxID=80249 RepID=A0A9N9X8A7_PHACE|nr:unnamed protein product [Phaedon cochleariae]
MCGKFDEVNIPGWRGFMEKLNTQRTFERSKVLYLLLNSPPSNYDTIYTVLCTFVEESKKLGINTTFVTFDQPLYVKVREIVAAMGRDSQLGDVVPRLGEFHLLMSFLGSIEYIMAGSGLRELLSVIYAPLSAEKMLGHAYSRAIRGHSLVQLALAKVILQEVDLGTAEREAIKDILHNSNHNPPTFLSITTDPVINHVREKISLQLQRVEGRGPTAKLWIQYFHMVTLVKQFIQCERGGDWTTHLQVIQYMLPFFHASGHILYA